MSQFAFLKPEFTSVYEHAQRAEVLALSDPRGSCFYTRLALETAVKWMYQHDGTLHSPYDDTLAALIHEGTFRTLVGTALVTKARLIKDFGNRAVHDSRAVSENTATVALRELFHFSYWLIHTYATGAKPPSGFQFSAESLPKTQLVEAKTLAGLQAIAEAFEKKVKAQEDAEAARVQTQQERDHLDAQIKRLRAEIAATKKANQAIPDDHDYNESETRDAFVDLLLQEAGWPLDQPRDREFSVTGMPNSTGEGYVDYVLWGDDGRPLAIIEVKRTKRDARAGQQQAKLYADCMEIMYGRRPIIFYTNGYEHWIWDDASHPPRPISGFLKKAELELLIQRRTSRKSLAAVAIDTAIVERFYQVRGIRRVDEAFELDFLRKVLLVMATGAGKTRTVIALIDQLMRAGWVKRVLFLADRVALVNQAVAAFKAHLPQAAPVNLVTEKDTEGRVYVATYPTMVGLIDAMKNGTRRFGAGHFDLIVIDEAHRSVYRKYRSIFDYFDSYLVGLTATPRDEIDRDTYSLFELERGVPTDAYDLTDAVADGFLVPARAVSVPLKFQREGIRYDDLSDDEKEQWDALEWSEDGSVPDRVDASALNKWLFNTDTVDKVLAHLMTHGRKVESGDRLGKTIIFAKNHDHAAFISERSRLRLIGAIEDADHPSGAGADGMTDLRAGLAARLFDEVAGMTLDNFIVRPKRRFVEIYQDKTAWDRLPREARAELAEHLAGLPSALVDDDLAAKEFDLLILMTQLAVLRAERGFDSLQMRIRGIAAQLEALGNVPMVKAQLQFIEEVQTDDYWQDVTAALLEHLRRRLRDLVKLIEPQERTIVYSDFEDEIGQAVAVSYPPVGYGTDKSRFLLKARQFLTQHGDHIAIIKLRRNEQLTPLDLTELERIFVREGIAGDTDLDRIRGEGGIGLFIRSLVGLEREAAKDALAGFMDGRTLTANQIEFIDLILNHLTEHGVINPGRLYESPFTDLDDQGVAGVFSMEDARVLINVLRDVGSRAAA